MTCQAFVVMPFDPRLDGVYQGIVQSLERAGFQATRADTALSQQNIMRDVVIPLATYDVVIADMTGLNPNVMYEIGLAHAFDRPVIMVTQDIEELPFDLRSYRVLAYSPIVGEFDSFISQLDDLLKSLENATFGNPVSDHIEGRSAPRISCGPIGPAETEAVPAAVARAEDGQLPEDQPHPEEVSSDFEAIGASLVEIGEATSQGRAQLGVAATVLTAARAAAGPDVLHGSRAATHSAVDAVSRHRSRIEEPLGELGARWATVDREAASILDRQVELIAPTDRAELVEFLDQLNTSAELAEYLLPIVEGYRLELRQCYGFDRGLDQEIDGAARGLNELTGVISKIDAIRSRSLAFRGRLAQSLDPG